MIIFIKILVIFLFLLLSGFFSGSETALFSLTPLDLRKLHHKGVPTREIRRLLRSPGKLLLTILVGNLLVNVAASSLGTSVFIGLLGSAGVKYAILVMTVLLLIFGEVTPKRIAVEKAVPFSLFSSKLLLGMQKFLRPLLNLTGKTYPETKLRRGFSEDEFKAIIDVVHKEGIVEGYEREMVRAVLEFADTIVKEVMTPRVDIKAIPDDLELEEVIKLLKEYKHSKVPVYKKSIDKIMGVIYTKDVLLNPPKRFTEYIRPVLFVPETKKINELLKIFEDQKLKIAIVVDEYGGTSGLVTFEDILEEIFGELYDEYEIVEKNIEQVSENVYRVVGKLSISELNEKFGLNIPEEEYDTIAGFIMSRLGKIPVVGEGVSVGGYSFTVENMVGRRITSVLVKKK